MHYHLPLSWIRTEALCPVYRDITLPLSGTRWITYADVPHHYSLDILQEDLSASFPDGYVFRGCTPEMGAYFVDQNCRTLRTGAEAVLDLQGSHLERKTVQSSLMRGRKQGVVEEIELTDGNMLRFEQFHAETTHGGKPQLQHVFRGQPSRRCRAFVFRTFGGQWLGAMTLSPRGNLEMHTELMLRRRNAPGDIMECLVAGIFETLRSENMGEWSLGEVPFMTLTQGSTDLLTPMEQLMVGIVSRCKHAYDFEGLYRFKNKFSPKWRPITLCVSEEPTTLLLTELAVAMGFAGLLVHESLDLLGQSIRFGFK